MGKYGLLLILAGLAVGLFLGFNPTTHRDLVRWWDSTNASHQRSAVRTAPGLISLRQFDNSVARLFRTAPKAEVRPQTQPATLPGWAQIQAALQAFWQALQKIWLSIEAKFTTAHSS